MQQFDPSNPYGSAPGQTGAPNQPGVIDGQAALAGAFQGWDDPQQA
jgi:hypothetical protein